MPRRVRIELAGYHHVYNRAIERKYILEKHSDKDKFLELLEDVCKKYHLTIHSYCIMDNHYHLLVESARDNLSLAMRQLNSKYATYYNKKYKRIGHLWQGRFKSWYILNETYLYTLFKYIESNPVSAKMRNKIGEYKYSSSYTMLHGDILDCVQSSFILSEFNAEDLSSYLNIPLNHNEIKNIETFHKEKLILKDEVVVKEREESLTDIFKAIKDKESRNNKIIVAFYHGYKQSEIARFLNISTSAISKIINKSGHS